LFRKSLDPAYPAYPDPGISPPPPSHPYGDAHPRAILDARDGSLWTETLVSFAVNKGVALNVN
jgi:hypothetical protein